MNRNTHWRSWNSSERAATLTRVWHRIPQSEDIHANIKKLRACPRPGGVVRKSSCSSSPDITCRIGKWGPFLDVQPIKRKQRLTEGLLGSLCHPLSPSPHALERRHRATPRKVSAQQGRVVLSPEQMQLRDILMETCTPTPPGEFTPSPECHGDWPPFLCRKTTEIYTELGALVMTVDASSCGLFHYRQTFLCD